MRIDKASHYTDWWYNLSTIYWTIQGSLSHRNKNISAICRGPNKTSWYLHKFALSKWGPMTSLILSLEFIAS